MIALSRHYGVPVHTSPGQMYAFDILPPPGCDAVTTAGVTAAGVTADKGPVNARTAPASVGTSATGDAVNTVDEASVVVVVVGNAASVRADEAAANPPPGVSDASPVVGNDNGAAAAAAAAAVAPCPPLARDESWSAAAAVQESPVGGGEAGPLALADFQGAAFGGGFWVDVTTADANASFLHVEGKRAVTARRIREWNRKAEERRQRQEAARPGPGQWWTGLDADAASCRRRVGIVPSGWTGGLEDAGDVFYVRCRVCARVCVCVCVCACVCVCLCVGGLVLVGVFFFFLIFLCFVGGRKSGGDRVYPHDLSHKHTHTFSFLFG